MDANDISSIDSLLEYLGGCGLFQVISVFVLHGAIMASEWSMVFMAYGNYNPGWTCQDNDLNSSLLFGNANGSMSSENESSCHLYSQCNNVVYGKEASTIATEWDLVCDRKWISNLMISMQMVGVLIGSLSSGQLNFTLGRKRTLYGSLAIHAILNLIASFSVNWMMFMILRFFIGITCGSLVITAFVYPMEFVTNKWRGVVAAIPFSSAGSVLFAVCAMLLRDWRHLHIATTILTVLFILPVLWVPDSLRWLAVKNKTKEAEKAGLEIAKMNRKIPPNMEVIHAIAENERLIEESKPRYTILDLYRHGLLKKTLILGLSWFTNVVVYYLIMYDVQSLSGNFFVNLIVFSCITTISLPFVPLLTNTVGRKLGIMILIGLAAVCSLIGVCTNFVEIGVDKGQARRVLVFMISIFIDGEWAITILYNVELYPTVLRSLSYSHGSCIGRVGGMFAPFLIPTGPSTIYYSQIVMVVLIVFTCFCLLLLPETKGKHLEESVTLKGGKRNIQELSDEA